MKAICSSVNADGVGIVLTGGGGHMNTTCHNRTCFIFLQAVVESEKLVLNCLCTLVPCKCSEIILRHKKVFRERPQAN